MKSYFSEKDLKEFYSVGEDLLKEIVNYWKNNSTKIDIPNLTNGELKKRLSITENGIDLLTMEKMILKEILPYTMPVSSNRYLGMMNPVPNPASVLGELLKAALNQNCSLYKQSPIGTLLEEVVVEWFGKLVGYSGDFFGTIVSGGSVGNLTGLKAARNEIDNNIREKGLFNQKRLRFYVSKERHYSIDRAMDVLGLGLENLVLIDVNENFKMDALDLERKIRMDINSGYIPTCVIGIAGTTNSGSVDDLKTLSEISKRYGCWFHVDAAYGGAALLLEDMNMFDGIEYADSVVIDPHKWFSIPLESGIVLFRNRKKLKENFSFHHSYYVVPDLDFEKNTNFFEYSIQGSRAFRALKIWMGLNYFGVSEYRNIVKKGVQNAKKLVVELEKIDGIEVLCKPDLSIVLFYYKDCDMVKIYKKLEHDGKFWFSMTELDGQVFFRINLANMRMDEGDFEELVNYLKSLNR